MEPAKKDVARRTCPACRRPASWAKSNPVRPFCSERCKWVDMGRWFDGSYRLEREPFDVDFDVNA